MNVPTWLKRLGLAAATAGAVGGTTLNTDADTQDKSASPSLEHRVRAADTASESEDTFHVTPDAPGDASGASWDDPTSLRSALNDAGVSDSVLVMDGDYETNGEPFTIDGEHVLGGIQSSDERRIDDAYTSDGEPTEFLGESSRVVTMRGGSLTNVRVADGVADGTGVNGRGGGVLFEDGDNTVRRVLFQDNQAELGGAALSIEDKPGDVTVEASSFTANTTKRGGAVFINGDRDVSFAGNTLHGNEDGSGREYYHVNSEVTNPSSITTHGAANTVIAGNALTTLGTSQNPVRDGVIDGTVTEEGQPLPDTKITITDDATVKATTTTNSDGSFSLPFSYNERDVTLGFSSSEHTGTDTTFTHTGDATIDVDAIRTEYDLAAETNGLVGGVDARLTVRDDLGVVVDDSVTNETNTYPVTTESAGLDASLDADGHKHVSTSQALDGDKAQSLTLSTEPWTHTRDVITDSGETLTVTHDQDTLTATTISDDTTTVSYDVRDDVVHGDDLAVAVDAPNSDPATATTTLDTTNTDQDLTLNPTPNTVTATINGTTTQEGQTLPSADVTFVNADADTTVGSTTTDRNGDYSFTTTYPADQAYQLNIQANTGDHEAKTKNVTLSTTDNTYTADVDLERLIYDLTINTDDANTNNAVDASGDILNNGTSLTSYTTGSDGQTTLEINTAADNVSSEANTTNYDPSTESITLGGTEDLTVTNALPPIQYTFTGAVTDGSGTSVADADIVVDDRDGNEVTTTTANDGSYSATATVNDGVTEDETLEITADKPGFIEETKTTSADPDNRTKTQDFTITEETTTITATINGTTTQEGQTLPGADITIRNADADTLVTQTTSDQSGSYETSTSYPDDQPYTAQVIANTPEHQADTTNVELESSSDTYSADVDLERLIYDLTINTDDANTDNPINANGTITADNTTLTNYTTGADGQTTITINTRTDQVTNEANTTNYDPATQTVGLNGDKTITTTLSLSPIQYTFTGTVTDTDNNALNDAIISLDDTDGNQLTVQTNTSGDYRVTGTINDGLEEDESITITADKDGFNESSQTSVADPDDRSRTIDFSLNEAVTNYTVEGDVTSSDGDTVTGATINLQDPDGTTVDTDNTDTSGFYSTTTTQSELGGDQATLQSNPAGYDTYTESLTLNEGTNTENITLQEILRDYTFNAEDANGNALNDVSIDIDETTSGSRDITTLTTGTNGGASTTLSADEQIIGGDELTFTASKDGYNNAETTDVVDTESETITLSLQEQTVTYDISGTLTDKDGDQLANKDVLIQTTGDNTVTSTTTASDGSYSVSVTQDELGGDTGEVQSNPTGYNEVETTKTFAEGSNTVDLSLPLTEYTRTFKVDDADGNALSNASIDADETTSGDRDVFTATTNSSGEHTETLTIDDMLVDGDQLEYSIDKSGYQSTTKTETLTDTTKTIDAALSEESTTDRVTITFNPKTVGNSLYSGGYSGELDYTVSTDDTTFTTTGSTTADVPISDGDQLEISQSDSEYISTFMVNNTDTEQPPMQVNGFPDEPDYQSTNTVSIDKSNLVNEYQVAGIPDTSPEGYSTINDWKPHFEDSDVRRWTDLSGLTSLETYIQEGHSQEFEERADTVVPEVQGFLPIPIDGPTYVTDSELQDIFDERDERNITRFDGGGNSFSVFTEGNYLKNTAGFFGNANPYGTVRSEVYGAFTGLDETDDHFIKSKILDTNNNDEFIPSEAKFPIRIIYSTESPTNIY